MSSIKIKIYGEEYSIRSKDRPEYVQKVADHVDKKMREVAATTNIVSTSKIAILAALNIADEYFRLKEDASLQSESVSRMVDELIRLLDSELGI